MAVDICREMDVTAVGAGCGNRRLRIADFIIVAPILAVEFVPEGIGISPGLKNAVGHDCFRSVAKIMEHFSNCAFIVKAHDIDGFAAIGNIFSIEIERWSARIPLIETNERPRKKPDFGHFGVVKNTADPKI